MEPIKLNTQDPEPADPFKKKKVYISGPITGIDRKVCLDHFRKTEELLTAQGYKTCNPTRKAPGRWPWLYNLMGYRLTLLYDLWILMRCDYIYKMQGWRDSKGCNIESCVAYHMHVYTLPYRVRNTIDKKLAKYKTRGIPAPTNVLSRKTEQEP